MLSETVLALSNWQMTMTSLLHYIFLPLTLGLSLLLASLEIRLVLSQDSRLKPTIQFWARLFAIQLILTLSTRLITLIQYGVSTSFFARYLGDTFSLPIAIESLSSFFLISALFGPFWFGWSKLSDKQHALITSLISLCLHCSAVWLLSAYAWLDNPGDITFNPMSLRLETTTTDALLNPAISVNQILHPLALAYAIAAGCVVTICCLFKPTDNGNSIRAHSLKSAAVTGVIAIALLAFHGHAEPLTLNQQVRQNNLRGIDNQSLLPEIQSHIRNGLSAYRSLKAWREDEKNAPLDASFDQQKADLGYALLLKRWLNKPETATDSHIRVAAQSLLPTHPQLLFWGHQSLKILALISLIIFASAIAGSEAFKRVSLFALPVNLLLIVIDAGLYRCQHETWLVDGLLPRFLAYSSLSMTELVVANIFYTLVFALIMGLTLILSLNIIRSQQNPGAQA